MKNYVYSKLFDIEKMGYNAYIIGGYVRDFLIFGSTNNDIDISTNAPVSVLLDVFSECKHQLFKHNTIKFSFNELYIDVAQFRREEYDGNRITVSFSNSIVDDALRRDFTINSIYLDKNDFVYFFNNSYEDLIKQRLRFIRDIRSSLNEDPTRLLRYIYFISKYGFDTEESEVNFLMDNATRYLEKVSLPSLQIQMIKLLKLNRIGNLVDLLLKINAYDFFFEKRISYTVDSPCILMAISNFRYENMLGKSVLKKIDVIRNALNTGIIDKSILTSEEYTELQNIINENS